jgi:hypothetical protein
MMRVSRGLERTMRGKILIWMIYPAYAIYWIARYSGLQPTWPRRIGMFVTFIPVLSIMTVFWLAAVLVTISVLRHVWSSSG